MNENKDKTCKKCAHRILKDMKSYAFSHCTIRDEKINAKGPACDNFENTEQEDKNERLRKIATRLEQLEKEYAEKKIDLESFIRQRSILIGKKEGLDAPKGKENYSFIKTIKI
jgi:hypothetical protein